MISAIILWIESIVVPFGAFGIILGSFIEEIIAIIPSALIQTSYGFLLFEHTPITIQSLFSLLVVVAIPASIGVTIGAIPLYYISYHGGKKAIERYGRYFGISNDTIVALEKKYENSSMDEWAIVLLRMIPILPSVFVCVGAGLLRVPFKVYISATFFGTIVRAFLYGFVGWQLGRVYIRFSEEIAIYEKLGLYIFAFIIVGLLIWWFFVKNKKYE